MMDECYQRCTDILREHADKLHAVAAALMERETLDAEEFYQIMKEQTASPAAEPTAEPAQPAHSPLPLFGSLPTVRPAEGVLSAEDVAGETTPGEAKSEE